MCGFLTIAAALLLTRAPLFAADAPPIPSQIVQLRVESADFSPSQQALDVIVAAEIAPGWHVNAHRPTSDALVPTTLSVTAPAGFEVGEIEYPEPESRVLPFAGTEPLQVYGGRIRFHIPLVVKTAFSSDGAQFGAKLHYQACDDSRCLRPAYAERTFLVKTPEVAAARATGSSANQAPVEQWLSAYGLAPTLFFVLVMGLGLNLTPCVYPLISVTVAFFAGQSRDRRGRAILLSSVYALGIAVTFSALGVAAALSGGVFGRALQHPGTLIGLASLMVVLALSSFGVYTLQLPAWLRQKTGSSGQGVLGALFMGLTMGIVAAPCVGPIVVGLLVAVGARGDAGLGFLLFFTLALGLGLPYVVLGAAASSIAHLPRSGEWLAWVERLFGFLLLGLGLYFASPLIPGWILRWTSASLIACGGISLGFLSSRGRDAFGRFRQAFGVLALIGAVWVALPPGSPAGGGIEWQAFSAQALEEARRQGRPAVVDFRADWCLPCIEMEKTTFVSPRVVLQAAEFSMLRADVTEMSPRSEDLLARYGVLGVPTTIFFATDGKENSRMVGYIAIEEFLRLLDEAAESAKTKSSGAAARGVAADTLLVRALGRRARRMLSAPVHRPEGERSAVLGFLQTSFPRSQQSASAVRAPIRALAHEHLPSFQNTPVRTHDRASREAGYDSGDAFQFKLLR